MPRPMKKMELTGRCGGCDHFKPIEGTARGYCLKQRHSPVAVYEPGNPLPIYQRSRKQCGEHPKKRNKEIDLTKRCGSCEHFKPKAGTTSGYCLKQKYDPEIAPDKENPYPLYTRTRLYCRYYAERNAQK